MGCAASIPRGGGRTAGVVPAPPPAAPTPSPMARSPTVKALPPAAADDERKNTLKHTPRVDTEPLKRLQNMIFEMGRRGKVELTSIVVREGSGEEPGTLTKEQIPSLRQIPGLIFSLTAITELVVRCNQILQVPKEINQLQALTVLDVSENQLTELPVEITELANLRVLEAAENNLVALPEAIGRLTKLETLRANRNKLRELPDSLSGCRKLSVLNVYNNLITTLGNGLHELTELEELTVSNNVITAMPAMAAWRKVKFLYLQANNLVELPPLDGLVELELLQVHQNALKELPSMENVPLLKKIDANCNQIREVSASIERMPQIVHLNFRKNRVTFIPGFLAACRTLEILDFGNNPVASPLPPELTHLSNLKTLLLDGTQVTHIPIELLGLQKLIRAHFGSALRMDDQETAEVVMDLRLRCKENGGWLKTG